MSNHIVYIAATTGEIHECAYSLLKYLDVYNLKPPANHHFHIYTHQPAQLEIYSSFFQNFRMLQLQPGEALEAAGKLALLKRFRTEVEGNILYLGRATYPVKEFSMLFSNMEKGTVYGSHYAANRISLQSSEPAKDLRVLGFHSSSRASIETLLQSDDVKSVKGIIEEYGDLKEFSVLLTAFFSRNQEESVPNQVKRIHHINARQIEEQKKQFQRLPLHVRMIRRFSGKGWNIAKYTSKID